MLHERILASHMRLPKIEKKTVPFSQGACTSETDNGRRDRRNYHDYSLPRNARRKSDSDCIQLRNDRCIAISLNLMLMTQSVCSSFSSTQLSKAKVHKS